MEERLKHVVAYVSNNESQYTDRLIQAFETVLSCFGEIKDEIAESINSSVKGSRYDDIGEKVSYCQDLDALMDFLNDQVNHLQKEDASPKTEDIDLEEDAENKKEVIKNCEAVDEKEFIYQVVPFSQDSKARFRRNIQSFYVKVTTKSKNGRKIIQEERLIPVFIDEKDKILYCYNEVIKMYGDVFSEHVVTLCDYSGKETIVKHIHPFKSAQ